MIFKQTRKIIIGAVLVLTLGILNFDFNPASPPHDQASGYSNYNISFSQFLNDMHFINEAYASSGPGVAGEIIHEDMAHMIRYMYMLINGPGANGYPTNFDGPPGGFLGLIREITGPTALGGGLSSAGYSVCADIPATGSASMTDQGGTFLMTFETPLKVIPAGYTGADGSATFAKRVTVQFNGTTFMNIEFNCDTTVGWMRMNSPEGEARVLEVFWDTETAAASKLELYMVYEAGLGSTTGNEYFATKFQTLADNKFKFWITRSENKTGTGNDQGFRAAAHGDATTKIVNAFILAANNITDTSTTQSDNNNISSGGDMQCLDLSAPTGTISVSTGCGLLDLTTTTGTSLLNDSDNITIGWTADTANGLKNDMTTLVDP